MDSNSGNTSGVLFSELDSRIIWIVVGQRRAKFSIRHYYLQQTAFFEKHGDPPTIEDKRERTAQAFPLSSPKKTDAGDDSDVEIVDDPDNKKSEPALIDYFLNDKYFHEHKPFEIMINWLRSENPMVIKTPADCRVVLKAYCLARYYNVYGLQNCLIDRLRGYYAKTKIQFADLNYIIDHLGDDPEASPLTQYLVTQIAYEIADNGFDEYCKESWFITDYLEKDDRRLRVALFRAIADRAHQRKGKDPARDKYDWHVGQDGEDQQKEDKA